MVFYWSLKDSKSPQISRSLLRILGDFNNAVVKKHLLAQRIFCISFSKTGSIIYIYHLVVWTNFNLLYNSQWITFPTHSCLHLWGCPCGVMVKVMDYGIVVSKFVLQLHYYIHFRVNTLGKGMNPLILPAMG